MSLHRTRIKFCGMTRTADALAAISLGVDALGFVFAPGTPRCLSLEAAAAIRRQLPPLVSVVALLRNAESALVQGVMEALRPDLLQFHGEEAADYCGAFGKPWIKAIAMRGPHRPLAISISSPARRRCCSTDMPPASRAARATVSTGPRCRRWASR